MAFQAATFGVGSGSFVGKRKQTCASTGRQRGPTAVLSIPSMLKVEADLSKPSATGSFGVVHFGQLSDGTPIVLKRARTSATARALFARERNINVRLRTSGREGAERWPAYLGTYERDSKTFLVWRRAGAGRTLEDYLSASASGALGDALQVSDPPNARLRVALFRRVTGELLRAVDALHGLGVVHRDIKPDNVLVAPGAQRPLQLIDFGAALDTRAPLWGRRLIHALDELYCAPERRVSLLHPHRFDVYSIGLIALRVLLPSMSTAELRAFRARLETDADGSLPKYRADFEAGRIGCGVADAELRALFNREDAAACSCFDALATMLTKSPGLRARASRALELL